VNTRNLNSSSPENLQRVGFLTLIPEILRRLGADPVEVLAAAGLSAQALDNPEGTIPYVAMGRILMVAADKTRCPHFALEIGKQIRTASLGLVGELMRSAPTLGVALVDFATHQHRNAHGSVVYLLTDKNQAFFGYAVYQPGVPGNHLICDGAAMAAFNIVCELADPGPVPVSEVLFSRSEPLDLTPWHRSFGVKLRFNADQTAVLMPRSSLDRPLAGADAGLRKTLDKRVRALWHAGEFDTVTQLRRALRIALLSHHISGNEISAQLGMSRRTLHRRLDAQGLRFQEVLDETRYEFAQQLLANTRLGIAEIGSIVGYNDPSVFTRGFIRWAGVPPSKWRIGSRCSGL
jgi:AraC-like DNA-binding protein